MPFTTASRVAIGRPANLQGHGIGIFPRGNCLEAYKDLVYASIQRHLEGDATGLLSAKMLKTLNVLVIQPYIRRSMSGQDQQYIPGCSAIELRIRPGA